MRWFGILAGEAVIEVLPAESLTGVKLYHFLFTVRTSPVGDLFHKLCDRVDSYTDINIIHSLLYKERHRARSEKEISVEFDWERNEVRYSSDGKKRAPVSIMPGTFDPLSVFYAFFLHELNNQIELAIPVTDGKKCIIEKARVIRKEYIRIAGLVYDSFLVEPYIEHIRGFLKRVKTPNSRYGSRQMIDLYP